MSIANKSMLVLAAALVTSVFSAASFAGVVPPVAVLPPLKARLPDPPPPPPTVQICIPAFFAGVICITV